MEVTRWRGSLWWQVGYSVALSGEELVTEVPPEYQNEYDRGRAAGLDKHCQQEGTCLA